MKCGYDGHLDSSRCHLSLSFTAVTSPDPHRAPARRRPQRAGVGQGPSASDAARAIRTYLGCGDGSWLDLHLGLQKTFSHAPSLGACTMRQCTDRDQPNCLQTSGSSTSRGRGESFPGDPSATSLTLVPTGYSLRTTAQSMWSSTHEHVTVRHRSLNRSMYTPHDS